MQSVFLDLKRKFESGEIDVSDSEEEGEGEGEGELDSPASDEDDGNAMGQTSAILCVYTSPRARTYVCTYVRTYSMYMYIRTYV